MANYRSKVEQKKLVARFLAVWGGSLGFVVGAALTALFGRWRGWWPPSEAHLRKYARQTNKT
jgi:hypothetical protein